MSEPESFEEVTIEANIEVREPIVVSVSALKGRPRLDVRHFYKTEDGNLAPTKRGINIPLGEAVRLVDTILTAYNASTGEEWFVIEAEGD